MIRKAPNINHLWAHLIVEELIRCGITQFFIAPGSRSTPLVTAVARHAQAQSIVHFDERGTAFAALGYARATGKPAVWITTSGTAVANGLPAVVEAFVDAVPLLILTADRPPELRNTGANQTISQPGIFSQYVRWSFDGPAPTRDVPPGVILTTIDQAVHRSAAGPVHLNWMFREPLAPQNEALPFDAYLSSITQWEASQAPYTAYAATRKSVDNSAVDAVFQMASQARRGVIVAGRLASDVEGMAVLQLAEKLNWPVFPDIGSQIGLGYHSHPNIINHYDVLLSNPASINDVDVVLQFGKRCVSNKLQNLFLSDSNTQYIVVDGYPDRLDPLHNVTFRVEAEVAGFCGQLTAKVDTDKQQTAWSFDAWVRLDKKIDERLGLYFDDQQLENQQLENQQLNNQPALTEPLVARTLSQLLRRQQVLVVGNSMPVRDLDVFGVSNDAVKVILNRGASGIDGLVATAAGASLGGNQPAVLFLGDLSLLHDLNSLAMLKNLPHPLVVVVVNNDGGGIFSFLPISSYNDVFEPYFAVPHGLNFKAAAKMFGLNYKKTDTVAAFKAAFQAAHMKEQSTIIEIQTNREENLAIHQLIRRCLMAD